MRYLAFLLIFFTLNSCYALRAYKFRKLELLDHERMPSVSMEKSANPFAYSVTQGGNYAPLTHWLDSNLANTYTAAFVVIKKDTIIYEKYFEPYQKETLLPSYSVIKSFISTLVGIANEEQKISSLQDPITKYIPELLKNDARFANIKIQDVLDMRSGIEWKEGMYNLKDDAIKMGFRPNIMKQLKKLKIASPPTSYFDYKSINTLLLALVVERATKISLEKYFEEKLWQPLGAASKATLNTDKKGQPIAFAGLNATARDFSLLGSLFLHKGNWNGKQIVSSDWVYNSTQGDTMDLYGGYKNQWWAVRQNISFADSIAALEYVNQDSLKRNFYTRKNRNGELQYRVKEKSGMFMANGILGQYIFVAPEKNLVIVRLGHYWRHPKFYVEGLMVALSESL